MIIVKDNSKVAIQRKDLSYVYIMWGTSKFKLNMSWHETIDREEGNTQIAPITLAEW